MADCSKTEVFLAETDRMCNDCDEYLRDNYCDLCPIEALCDAGRYRRSKILNEAIEYVQKWSDEHTAPKPKTYADVFFEEHPKAGRSYLTKEDFQNGKAFPTAKRCHIYGIGAGCCMEDGCTRERQSRCWNEPYKEGE